MARKKQNLKPQPKKRPLKQPHKFKKRPDGKNATGAPAIKIDLAKVRLFSQFQPTDEELAAALDMCPKTFATKKAADPEIEKAMLAGRAKGRFSLRGKQFQKAMEGDNTMLIWAGKQFLDQKEKSYIGEDPDAPFNKPIEQSSDLELIARITDGLNELGIKVISPPSTVSIGSQKALETVSGAADTRS